MKTLDNNWFSEGWIDFEYKQYILLDYLQQSEKFYQENRLYPFLSDLLDHYKQLVEYRKNRQTLEEDFPKKIIGVDVKNKTFIYRRTIKNNFDLLDVVEEIVDFSIPAMKEVIERGKRIYKKIEESIEFHPVGAIPYERSEGYILVRHQKKIHVYRYRFSMVESKNKLSVFPATKFTSTLTNTPGKIKEKLIERYQDISNPATYFVDIECDAPLEETLIPIIKRRFVKDYRGL